ncbi:MAG: cell division protein ZapA [Pseudomonadota bacterium]
MNVETTKALDIRLLDRELKVACPDGEEKLLLASVDYLNQRMQELKTSGRVVGNERIALLVALNITHEFLTNKTPKGFDLGEVKRRIEAMQTTINDALVDQDKLF